MNTKNTNSVRVAARIRPQSTQERANELPICLSVTPGKPHLIIGRDKAFTFDFIFDQLVSQATVYEKCVKELVDGAFEGYNATVFAYGQTGSGKTFTIGTSMDADPTNCGIIPRAAQQLFDEIEQRREDARKAGRFIPSFDVSAQFIELYNEELVDLLSLDRDASGTIKIQEDPIRHEIVLLGVSSRAVTSAADILAALSAGAQRRRTAATNMNNQSSRSHAILTVNIKQTREVVSIAADEEYSNQNYPADDVGRAEDITDNRLNLDTELETLQAKFHFVDLAGSERLSRTGATGDRAKESISINSGLLALGNVISALGNAKGRIGRAHVPYRDSKLTRLLQDSLGGNSRTFMLACVSPNEVDFNETLSSLHYASRAKYIKNKVVANQNKPSTVITELQNQIKMLKAEVAEWQTVAANQNKPSTLVTGLQTEVKMLKTQKAELIKRQTDESKRARDLMVTNSKNLVSRDRLIRQQEIKIKKLERDLAQKSDKLKQKFEEVQRMKKRGRRQTMFERKPGSQTSQMKRIELQERRQTMFEGRKPLVAINEQQTPNTKHVERLNTTYIVDTPTESDSKSSQMLGELPEEKESNYQIPPVLSGCCPKGPVI